MDEREREKREIVLKWLIAMIGSLAAVGGMLAASTSLFVERDATRDISLSLQTSISTLNSQLSDVRVKVSELGEKVSNIPPITPENISNAAVLSQLEQLKRGIGELSESNLAMRQALNPLKPEEILTIARLKDEIVIVKKEINNLSDKLSDDFSEFRTSVRNEVDASNAATTLILVVLIPLVLNFLYTVWKDLRKERRGGGT